MATHNAAKYNPISHILRYNRLSITTHGQHHSLISDLQGLEVGTVPG